MRKSLQEPVRVYKKKNKARKAFRRIACVLGCVVAFVTTYALILPAITMEQTAFCGIEEHIHDESCYQRQIEKYEMICDVGLQLHVHSSECYHENGSILCGQADYVVHSHDAFCWDAEGQLICTLPERAAHIHDSGCYTMPEPVVHSHSDACITEVMGDLICTQQTDQGHMHAEACYSEETQLVCELEEDHIHDDTCYRQVLLCQTEESEGHTHSEVCYQWNQTYLCGLEEGQQEAAEPQLVCSEPVAQTHIHTENCFKLHLTGAELACGEDHEHAYSCYEKTCTLMEHTHSLQCYSDPDADVETQQTWESTLQNVELTGDKYLDVIAIAESQLGYVESTRNYIVGEDNSIYGYTRYGDWYGVPYGDWCAMYASFCLRYAGVDTIPVHSVVGSWIEALTEAGLYSSATETQPKPGCLVFFDWEEDAEPDHVGFVVEVTEGSNYKAAKIKTIEGNSQNMVQYEEYDLTDPAIVGYGFLSEEKHDSLLDSLICGIPAHTHDANCVDCQITEHTHMIDCVAPENPVGYAYRESMTMMRFTARSNENVQYYSDIKPLLSAVTIKDAEGNTVYPSSSSTDVIEITIGENYEVTLTFKEQFTKQFADGTLTYQIPEFLVSENVKSGFITVDEEYDSAEAGKVIATYIIEGNLLTVTPIEGSNFFVSHNDVEFKIHFDAEAVINEQSSFIEIDFGNNHKVNASLKEDGTIDAQKELVSYDPQTRILTYKCTATAHGGRIKLVKLYDNWWAEGLGAEDITISGITLTDGNGTDVTNAWNTSTLGWIVPYNEYFLNHKESVVLTYQIKLSDNLTRNLNFQNTFGSDGMWGSDGVWDTHTVSTPINFNNVQKSGVYESETVNGIQNALMWTVEIPNPDKQVITVTDELVGRQTYCQHKEIFLEATREDSTIVYLTVPWESVQLNDEHTSFTYTLPEGYVKYVLKYSSHYVVDEANPDIQSFDNTIKTYVNGSNTPNVGTGSVDVLGIPPTIRKEITAITDEYLTFSVECFMPASLNGRNSILLYDSLTSWGNEEGYIYNDPKNLTVTVSPKDGTPYQLAPYSEQGSTENTYLTYGDGAGFTMLFNTSQQDSKTSLWMCNVDSTLTITYNIPLNAPMLSWWSGEETGETLQQFLDRTGQKLTNKADLFFLPEEYVTNSTEYIPPTESMPPLSKTGEVAKNQEGVSLDGVFDYTVWFNPCEEESLFNTLENGKNDVSGLTITDTFDARMEYVPGSLQVSLWGIWNNTSKTVLVTFVPKAGSISQQDITLEDGTKVTRMTVSAENLIGQADLNSEYAWLNGKPLSDIMPDYHENYRYEITYQLRVKAEEKKTTEGEFKLENSVEVDWTDSTGPRSIGPVEHEMVYNTGILDKSMHTHDGDNNLIDFEVHVNHYGLDLAPNSDTYILHDTMSSNLLVIYNTLTVQILDADGNVKGTLSLDECNFTFEPDRNRMNFTLPDNEIILLKYECKVNATGGRATNVKNTVELEGYSSIQDAVDTMFEVKDHHGSASASSTSFTLQKQDAYTLHGLPNVSFELYGDTDPVGEEKTLDVGGGPILHYYGTFTTDEHGRVEIKHSQLTSGHKYALVEVEPPPGYLEQEEPYVFYMGYDAPAGIDIVAEGGFLVIQNYPIGYELPETGGAGYSLYIGAGLLLILTSAAYLMYIHSKRRKEVP